MKSILALGLVINVVGTVLVFLDSWRTASRFSEDGVALGYGPEYSTWFWKWCGRSGLALLGLGFLIQLWALYA